MAKKTTTTVIYTCDFCGTECDPVRELVHYHSTDAYGHNHNRIILHIAGEIPYGGSISGNDVCRDCVREALLSVIKNLGGDGKEAAR